MRSNEPAGFRSAPTRLSAAQSSGSATLRASYGCAGQTADSLSNRIVPCPSAPACAAALQGQNYKREIPETAARGIRRGAS